jgi:hypothetical protein
METIFEEAENNPKLLSQFIHQIKNLILLDETKLQQIRVMNSEEKIEIIIAFNEVVKSLMTLLD